MLTPLIIYSYYLVSAVSLLNSSINCFNTYKDKIVKTSHTLEWLYFVFGVDNNYNNMEI